jgi:glycosyltransferase involved in cell wall biosynthesis
MKNLDFALKVMAKVKTPIVFNIYGPISDATYWNECKALISALPVNIKIVYEGEAHPSNVKKNLAKHELFFLPTRGENYGHVIHEALTAGLPVLISNQTPWNEVMERGVGWAFPLDSVEPFVRIIESVYGWSSEKHRVTARHATSYACEKAIDSGVIAHNKAVFMSAISGELA